MWLLSTDRAELVYFATPGNATGGYAILSHTWGKNEQSFQDVQAFAARCRTAGTNPRDAVSAKIRHCCLVAESHGYKWVWIDSCCMNKESSSETSETINSMFAWYAQAEICYAYLEDVPPHHALTPFGSPFRESRWHTRGWTLQELIAPAVVLFLSHDWQPLGTKFGLARLLQDITGISESVLTHETHFFDTSVSGRMVWASNRSTTRVEDEGYCLMGLFGVNMPTIYGEGRQAFQRLQHEILKQSNDTTLFAWGNCFAGRNFEEYRLDRDFQATDMFNDISYLFARSPKMFTLVGLSYTPFSLRPLQPYLPYQQHERPTLSVRTVSVNHRWSWKFGNIHLNVVLLLLQQEQPDNKSKHVRIPFGRFELPRFGAINRYGVKCRLPIAEVDGYTVAVLLCQTDHEYVGLLLHRSSLIHDHPNQPLYYTSCVFRPTDVHAPAGLRARFRLIAIGNDLDDLHINGRPVESVEWRTIHIAHMPLNWASPDTPFLRLTLNRGSMSPDDPAGAFRIPHWLIARFVALGFAVSWRVGSEGVPKQANSFQVVFSDPWSDEYIVVELGLCHRGQSEQDPLFPSDSPTSSPRRVCWARARLRHVEGEDSEAQTTHQPAHDCLRDHIDSWPMRSRVFGDRAPEGGARGLRLSFLPYYVSRLGPSWQGRTTLLVHIELRGTVYALRLLRADVRIPTCEELGWGATGTGGSMPVTTPSRSVGRGKL